MYNSVLAIFVSAIFWGIFYYGVRIWNKAQTQEFCSRVITLAHGVIVSILGVSQCFSPQGSPIFQPLRRTTNTQEFILVISLGYFIVDTTWCMVYKTETKLMVCHHVCTCYALTRMLYKGTTGGQATCSLGAMELTNPFLQARWFIRTYGYHKTPLFATIELVFMFLFFAIRIIFGTMYFLIVLFHRDNDWEYVFISFLLYVISWMFVINIINYLQIKYTLPRRAPEEDVSSAYMMPQS